MEKHAYRIHHVAKLLLKNEGQRIMKEYFNLQGETIPKFFSLSVSLDHSLKEVSLIWDDWERFKGSPEYFIADNEKLYREYDETINVNQKRKEKPYFLFNDGVSGEKIQGRVNIIHKTVTTHYKYRHVHSLYSRPSTNPLVLMMHNKMSNFIFSDTSAPLSDGIAKFIFKGRNGTVWTQPGNLHFSKKEMECVKDARK
jgi:hypothetical protein